MLERHRGPAHLETIPCLFTGHEPTPQRGSTVGLQSRHFPGRPCTIPGHMIGQSCVPSLRDPFHPHYRMAPAHWKIALRAAVCILRQNCRIFEFEGHTEGTSHDWLGKCDNPDDRAGRSRSVAGLLSDPPSLRPFRSSYYRGAADARCVASRM